MTGRHCLTGRHFSTGRHHLTGWQFLTEFPSRRTSPSRIMPPTRNNFPTRIISRQRLAAAAAVVFLAATFAAAQSSPKAAMLEEEGWTALKSGRAQAAADAFRGAIALEPRNAQMHLGAGIAAFLQRRDADARALLERALSLDPSLTEARIQLAQVFRRQQDFQGAIRLYQTALAERPGDSRLRDTLERWKREMDLHDRMRTAVGDHFTVSFEGPEDAALAARVIESLDRAFWRISDVFGVFPPRSIPVVLYTGEQFQDITRSPQWAAGAYDGIIRVPVRGALEKEDELDRVLAHEFTHALVRSLATRNIPAWLNEGLASVLEGDDLSWADERLSGLDALPPLDALSQPFGRLSGMAAQVAYALSAVSVRQLLDEAGGPAIANLLRDLGEGIAFEEAFLHRVQKPFADFQASLRTSVKGV